MSVHSSSWYNALLSIGVCASVCVLKIPGFILIYLGCLIDGVLLCLLYMLSILTHTVDIVALIQVIFSTKGDMYPWNSDQSGLPGSLSSTHPPPCFLSLFNPANNLVKDTLCHILLQTHSVALVSQTLWHLTAGLSLPPAVRTLWGFIDSFYFLWTAKVCYI